MTVSADVAPLGPVPLHVAVSAGGRGARGSPGWRAGIRERRVSDGTPAGERGSATVWVLAPRRGARDCSAPPACWSGAAVVARHRADRRGRPRGAGRCRPRGAWAIRSPARRPPRWRAANGASLRSCRCCRGRVVDVSVTVPVRLGPLGVLRAPGRARAGRPAVPRPRAGWSEDQVVPAVGSRRLRAQAGRATAQRRRVRPRLVLLVGRLRVCARPARRGRRPAPAPRRPCPAGRCRCRTWATARTRGSRSRTRSWPPSPGSPAATGAAPRSRARRNPRRRGGRRRRRSSPSPVSGCRAVESPPRSQRSQVASSGRMPIAACSAACSEPGSSTSSTSARSTARSSRVSQTARVRSCRAGRSSGNSASTSPVPSRRRW